MRFFHRLRAGLLFALFLFSSLALSFTPFLQSTVYGDTPGVPYQGSSLDVISADGTQNISLAEGGDLPWYELIDGMSQPFAEGRCSRSITDNILNARTSGYISVSQHYNEGWTFGESPGEVPQASISVMWDFTDVGETVQANSDPLVTWASDLINTDAVGSMVLQISNAGTYQWLCNEAGTHFFTNFQANPCLANYPTCDVNASYYYSTFTITYPSDYVGTPIVSIPEIPIPPETNVFKPSIGYSLLSENKITGLWIGNSTFCIPTTLEGCIQPKLRWTIYGPDNTTVLNTVVQSMMTPYNYTFPGVDTYFMKVEFVHPGTPYAPFSDDVVLKSVSFELAVNGTFVNGGTGLQTCEEGDDDFDCGIANPLEDCSTYGLDLGGYFGCIINNFGIWLRNTLIDLFVPTYSYYNNWVNDFGTFLNSKLGFVATGILTIVSLFTTIIENGASTACTITPPGTFFDATLTIDVCTFQTIYSAGFVFMQTVLISLTLVALAFAGYRKYLEVVDHR